MWLTIAVVIYSTTDLKRAWISPVHLHIRHKRPSEFHLPKFCGSDGSGKYVNNTNVYTQDGNIGFWAYQMSNGTQVHLM